MLPEDVIRRAREDASTVYKQRGRLQEYEESKNSQYKKKQRPDAPERPVKPRGKKKGRMAGSRSGSSGSRIPLTEKQKEERGGKRVTSKQGGRLVSLEYCTPGRHIGQPILERVDLLQV